MIDVSNMMTVDDAAEYIGIAPSTLMRWLQRGHVKSVKFGNKLVFDKRDIEKLDVESISKPGRK